ncbi:DUF1446-domain-containing protein [Aspergillus terreus]|uniref:DUF1446-domain-containing protein n=1 Tax=Aspergillus terreus TaxID=33178 RepID=A0A5M3YPT3_ASPTE|nr:hypothetical protein ATETN484_0002067600 [Aspergillus terreus]GFF15532.1 DUF1446-domain-containing protein [Aspergillus terreus]
MRHVEGKPYYEYHPALLPQSAVKQHIHPLWDAPQTVIDMPLAPEFRTYDRQQPIYETKNPVPLDSFGPAVGLPLGRIVLGRSGDKCSDCNAGFFVHHDNEWDWLRGFLTVAKIRELLEFEDDKGKPIDQFEMPNIRAVHFLLHDHLERGYNSCSTYVTLGKNCLDLVGLPRKFVDRGTVYSSGSG